MNKQTFKDFLEKQMYNFPMGVFRSDDDIACYYYTLYSAYLCVYFLHNNSVSQDAYTKYLEKMSQYYYFGKSTSYNEYHCTMLKQEKNILVPWKLEMCARRNDFESYDVLFQAIALLNDPLRINTIMHLFEIYRENDLQTKQNPAL